MSYEHPERSFILREAVMAELDSRNWTRADLARDMGKRPSDVNRIVAGYTRLTPETARLLTESLGKDAEFWLELGADV